ncbi:DEAD/DEAH box helicase [Oceaniglobus indicus]|uniref:DEAD/DEAH box helicase n=1 Tax=Oceaniglobus indicus TaxID=2047749 RepID=UPI000C185EE5|nr:DEAD/DEAH box helicase [Oceaniglobus indicus]
MIQTLSDALAARGYDTLTPVQQAVTDAALDGADLLVSAQTGSGKTVGFGLAIGPTLLDDDGRFGAADAPLALIIAPTRELALQVKRELMWLYANTGAVVTSCVGGMDMRDERRALDRGAHIVVATPGRLRDHIMRGSLKMDALRAVVLDEADEMLDLGFREDLEFILGEAPETRRTLLFSATVPKAIATLAKNYQKDAVRVSTTAEKSQHSDISYQAMTVAQQDAENAIINVLRFFEAPNALVFCNTRAMVNRLTTRFSNRGFSVVALSGELTQNERTHALQAMRDGRARVCVATDVAARGIDLPNLELVIHAELPSNSETLLHRSGRTGRAGRKGVSALIVPQKVRKKAERLLQGAKVKAEWTVPPSADDVRAKDEERLLEDPIWDEDISEEEAIFAERLLDMHAPDKIAAAYMRLFRTRQSAPEDLSDPGAPPPPRAPFGPSVWFSIAVGRSQNAEPRWLLPMLCKAGGLSKDDIGAIRIQHNESFVEITQASADGFLRAIGPAMTLEGGTALKKLDRAPEFAPRGPRPEGGARPDRAERPDRPAKPRWQPDNPDTADAEAKPAEKYRAPKPVEMEAPKPDAAIKPKPSTDAPAKPKAAYAAKPDNKVKKPWKKADKPEGKAPRAAGAKSWDKPARPADGKPWEKSDKPRKPKPAGKPYARPEAAGGKPAAKPAADARDPSKRFVPPGAKAGKPGPRAGKPGGKPFGKPMGKPGAKPGGKAFGVRPGKGPDSTPRRKG